MSQTALESIGVKRQQLWTMCSTCFNMRCRQSPILSKHPRKNQRYRCQCFIFLCFSHGGVECLVLLAFIVARPQTTKPKDLQTIPSRDVKERLRGQSMTVLNGYRVDVGAFARDHPGGECLFRAAYGWRGLYEGFWKLNRYNSMRAD